MEILFFGAAGEVTGSCHLLRVGQQHILLDCGLFQGRPEEEARNAEPFPFDPARIDAVVLSHAHIDHSGRIPLLIKSGFSGPVYTQRASRDLCRIMLKDAAYLNEKEADWENRKRERKGLQLVEPLYTMQDAQQALRQFKPLAYNKAVEILPGVTLRLSDAGHILGSAIIELWLSEKGKRIKLVFTGDLGNFGLPILRDPSYIEDADWVMLESTYGDRLHRSLSSTIEEIGAVIAQAYQDSGNILIPAFAVGRSQELLYLFAQYYQQWQLNNWQLFLDSPMAIEATDVYSRHFALYDSEASRLWRQHKIESTMPNLHFTRTANQSIRLNRLHSGAIIIAGSGMCNGGRIRHHFKHNIWKRNCHVIITGFQAEGTLGRALVDGAQRIRLWGEEIKVAASIHTIGGLSAHADQNDLIKWYQGFNNTPRVILVHGEQNARETLKSELQNKCHVDASTAQYGKTITL